MKGNVGRLSLLLTIILCVVALLAWWPGKSSKQTLPDGTTLVLSGLKVGRTNVYIHGNWISKTIGRLVPVNGVGVAGFRLESPERITINEWEGSGVLSAQIHLLPDSPREEEFVPWFDEGRCRLLIFGDDDFAFVAEHLRPYVKKGDGMVLYPSSVLFPRDSQFLRFRIERRDERGWQEVVTFTEKNPTTAQIQPWKADRSPHFKLANGLDVELGDLVVRHEQNRPSEIWVEYVASLPIRITSGGQALTNWGIVGDKHLESYVQGGKLSDASGNAFPFYAQRTVTNDWILYRMFHPMDPTKVWRFQVTFGQESDFDATNTLHLSVPPAPAGRINIQTNLGAIPVGIQRDSYTLAFGLSNLPTDKRVTIVKAADGQGRELPLRGFHRGSSHHTIRLGQSQQTQTVHVTVGIQPDYPAEFFLQPRLEMPAQATNR